VTTSIEIAGDLEALDRAVAEAPNAPAVFALWPRAGAPYLGRTALLRRRLLRLLKERAQPSRLLNLRHTVGRIEYHLTGSSFESAVVLYEEARRLLPETYLELLKLRMPPYVKIVTGNPFPRSAITTHLTRSGGVYYGPFRSRASAEKFESQCLDLFQMRRCQEDLAPAPDHPGCIYGEMNMCLRPCQEVVGPAEYAHEAARVEEFLRTGGESLLAAIAHSRDRLSEEMRFEEAARQHKRYEKVQEVLKLRDELACELDGLHGVAITRSAAPDAVELWVVRSGWWQAPARLSFEVKEGKPVPLDKALREAFAGAAPRKLSVRERQEYLALLARWHYSSWREGEWVSFASFDAIPYRRVVNAVSRVARREPPPA
jgi:excinuclease UvrABC nuclease subunit